MPAVTVLLHRTDGTLQRSFASRVGELLVLDLNTEVIDGVEKLKTEAEGLQPALGRRARRRSRGAPRGSG